MTAESIKPRQRRRFEFIEFHLMWEGSIGRRLLQEQFEISPQQATLDLTGYLDFCPKAMSYDPRQRTYVARPNFKPTFLRGDASEYLVHLEALHHEKRAFYEIWPARTPDFDVVSMTVRKIEPNILRTVLHAIRDCQGLQIMYVSLSSESERPRNLYPHAIASDGHRWHMRAYDADKNRFSDFVLSRIEKISPTKKEVVDIPNDEQWTSFIELRLRPDPSLKPRQQKQLKIEYAMVDGQLSLRVRKAMLFYYLRFYGFDPLETESGIIRNKSSYSLSLENIEEVEECIGRRS